MIGTEKQVKWAEDIKKAAYNELGRLRRNFDRILGEWSKPAVVPTTSKNIFPEKAYENATKFCGYEPQDLDKLEGILDAAFADDREAAEVIKIRSRFERLEEIAQNECDARRVAEGKGKVKRL